jgi:hypothetical protein
MKRTRLGTNEDGSPQYHYEAEDGEVLVFTGRNITGTVEVAGAEYDINDQFTAVPDEATAAAVADAVGARFESEGHPLFAAEPHDFVHTPSEG